MSHDDGFGRPPFEKMDSWVGLWQLIRVNINFFSSHIDENSTRIVCALNTMSNDLRQIYRPYKKIIKIAPLYDYDEDTPANGYRSFIIIVDKCILHCDNVCRRTYEQRASVLFRKAHHAREIEACSRLLTSVLACLDYLKTLHKRRTKSFDGKPSLFTSDGRILREMLDTVEMIDQHCFYGRCIGFQFCDGFRNILKGITACMAWYSEAYFTNGGILGRCANSLKYLIDPEARARRVLRITQRADIHFCKTFWFLNECDVLQLIASLKAKNLALNNAISIPPEELNIRTTDGRTVQIPIPSSHIGRKPIRVKLLSTKRRIGMVGSAGVSEKLFDRSDVLVIHCHGGGFVSQSSKSHEVYLKNWAVALDAPILTIDYSLAPEAPFPRALEEVLYAYVWALNHGRSLLGTTATTIIFTGDSAGANLMLATTIRCVQLNIKKPDGIFMAYTPVWVQPVLSPSRLLCLADPLLPFGFMVRCLTAYAGLDSNKTSSIVDSDTESCGEVSASDPARTSPDLSHCPNAKKETNVDRLTSMNFDTTFNNVSGTASPTESVTEGYTKKFIRMSESADFGCSESSGHGNNGMSVGKYDKSNFFEWCFGGELGTNTKKLDVEFGKTHLDEFALSVPRDPLLSPYLAPDSVLGCLPPVKILTLELDPCLDDSIMFGRKLKSLGNNVSLDILSGLPHGFLNLCAVSKEANDGSRLCVTRIQELIDAV